VTPSTVAVTIAAYNAEAYIVEALDSVAAQTRRPDQLIVVDDGSTDRTAERVRHWAGTTGLHVELLQQENRGLPGSRNRSIRHARTELIALLDADDVFLPEHLASGVRAFEHGRDVVLAFADAEAFDTGGVVRPSLLAGTLLESLSHEQGLDGLRTLNGSVYSSLLWGNYVPVGTTIFRRDAAERAGLYDEAFRFADDRDFYLRLSRMGRFAYYPRIALRKREHGENLTNLKNRERYRRSQLLVLRKMWRMAAELRLSQEEVRRTQQAIAEQATIMLYHAAERGIVAYLDMCGFLWKERIRGPLLNVRDWVRAAAFSSFLRKRFR
jgi:teichuronic acid biosynthesis glycosyltransferase TuaG